MRRGFTLVEMLIVIAVIGVLGGIITTAAVGAIKNGRSKRADAMCVALEQGIAAYYAQEGKWPEAIENRASSMTEATYTFSQDEADSIFQDVVGCGFGKGHATHKAMLVDATALFVCDRSSVGNSGRGCYDNHSNQKSTSTFCGGRGCRNGIDFSEATRKGGKVHIPFSQMAFGFQGPENGRFCRFWITYNGQSDSVKVWRPDKSDWHGYWRNDMK